MTYKIIVSILFGIIGFFINFNSITYPVGEYTVTILLGLLFPLIISISWGWRYGLLSALAGGSQSMWWLWGPSTGYAAFCVIPPFTLWIVWHGYLAQKRKNHQLKWWTNMYLGEIPFRLLNTLNLLTITRWAVHQNPPTWEWASNASNIIPYSFTFLIIIKPAIIGFILLLTVDVLLNLPIVQNFFGLKKIFDNHETDYIISGSLLIGVFYWFLDSFIYSYLDDSGLSFINYLISDIPQSNLYTRTIFFICCLVAGLITSKLLHKQRKNELALYQIKKESTHREALLSSLINSIPDLIWLKNKKGIYLACNPRFEKFFNAKENEIIGKTDYDFIDKELADYFRFNDKKAIMSGKSCINEEEVIFSNDGHKELLETTKTPMFNSKGKIIGILGIGRNITERKNLQNQLSQAKKLESIGRLAGGVAHDFNNMLSVIIGNCELIQYEIQDNVNLKNRLQQITYAAKRSAGLTKQLLTFARKETISPKKIDLNFSIEIILKMLRRLIGENIELIWKPDDNLWKINMDVGQIDQIMTNMCINASDSIKDIGTITIETKNVSVDGEYCKNHNDASIQDYVMLVISDNGCGMSKEIQEHIFEPFYTTKNDNNAPTTGTGLGLATVYGIMKQNKGFINVYSEINNGSTFKLFFPKHTKNDYENITPENEYKKILYGNETILLVEDEQNIMETVKAKLEKLGYTIYAFYKTEDAICSCKNINNIDLLITDVIMPKMNGMDLNNKIKSIHPHIKTLFMSGYTSDVIAHHGILHKGINFIDKPFSLVDISIKIREILDEKKLK